MENTTPVVFVVDDDVSVRESLELLLRTQGWHSMTFASAAAFLAGPRVAVPNCLILDVGLPDLSGLDLQNRLAQRRETPIIFITGNGDVPMTVRAMKAGAVEFLTKPFADDRLLEAIHHALEFSRGEIHHQAELQSLRACHESLTHREREVMALVTAGLLNKQVGARLGISEITVKAHRGKVMEKMKAGSLANLVKMAGRLDLAAMSRD